MAPAASSLPIPLEERFVDWRSGKERDVITFLASLAGERLFFEGDNSAGVGGDLQNATAIVAGHGGLRRAWARPSARAATCPARPVPRAA